MMEKKEPQPELSALNNAGHTGKLYGLDLIVCQGIKLKVKPDDQVQTLAPPHQFYGTKKGINLLPQYCTTHKEIRERYLGRGLDVL
jgi:hypothetical protein